MAYRKDNEKTVVWRKWLRQNEKLLNECHLPDLIVKSESHWWDFLHHGFLDHHEDSGNFTVDDLSEKELRNFKKFLDSVLTPQEKQSAIILLQIESRLNDLRK